MKPTLIAVASVSTTALLAGSASAKITIDLDYSLDTNGFFSTGTANGLLARATLERAADTFSDRFLDTLNDINEFGQNTWLPNIPDPATGNLVNLTDLNTVAADTLKVYAGGRSISGSTVGMGGPGGWNANGFQPFFDNL